MSLGSMKMFGAVTVDPRLRFSNKDVGLAYSAAQLTFPSFRLTMCTPVPVCPFFTLQVSET